jgi:hypothetical protein
LHGEKDKEGRLSGKGEKTMGRMLTVGWVGEKDQESSYEEGWERGEKAVRWWEVGEKEKESIVR